MTMRGLFLAHRWLGLILGPLVALWLVSGVIMLFVHYPSLSQSQRLAALAPVQRQTIQLLPTQAWHRLPEAQSGTRPLRVQLGMQQGRPVYYFLVNHQWSAVWADNGATMQVTPQQARVVAERFLGQGHAQDLRHIKLDQWTFSSRLDDFRPLYKVVMDDREAHHIYVSGRTGQVVMQTSAQERFWNFPGAVTHWLYFTALRSQRAVWRQSVLWLSAISLALAISGLWIGVKRLRLHRRYSDNRHTPYRGIMRIHHIAGIGCGGLLCTWLFSGWLSLTPMQWLSERSLSQDEIHVLQAPAKSLAACALPYHLPASTKLLEWRWFMGRAQLIAYLASGERRLDMHDGHILPAYTQAEISGALSKLQPGVKLRTSWLTQAGDAYVVPARQPTIKVSFSNRTQVSYYVDAYTGDIIASHDTRSRYYRWLFTGLHTWNFPIIEAQFWRKGLIIVASVVALLLVLSGLYQGMLRLHRARASRSS